MASLTIKSGTRKECRKGRIDITGSVVKLVERNPKTGVECILFAYHLNPGETVTRIGDEEDYVVEY